MSRSAVRTYTRVTPRRRFADLARSAASDAAGTARIGASQIYIFPTGMGFLFAGVLLLTLLGSLNYQNNLGLFFTFLMGGMSLVGMYHTWLNLLGLRVTTRGGAPVFAGQEASFLVTWEDDSGRWRADLVAALRRQRALPVMVREGEATETRLRVDAATRGQLALRRVRLETRYPLGLFRAWCYAESRARVTVYPRPSLVSPEPPLMPAYRPSAEGAGGVGADDYVGPRGYRVGDSPRRMDWKAVARERGLVVKQFGGDRAEQVWLDWERFPLTDTETRLGLLCRQVIDAAERGLSFGLRLPGESVPLGSGDAHRHRCLEALAGFGQAPATYLSG